MNTRISEPLLGTVLSADDTVGDDAEIDAAPLLRSTDASCPRNRRRTAK
jgi:hypothetical protein